MFASPKTSWAGIGAILAVVGAALSALFDADPATTVNWEVTIAGIIAGIGLIMAKDELKPPVPPAP